MKYLLIISFCLGSFLINAQIEIIKFPQLEEILKSNDEKIKVINFWATWCAPCVKELPYFEKASEIYEQEGLEIILVNLDFAEQKQKVEKFIAKHVIKNRVVLLDEIDYNSWIDKINKNWSGAIPATIIIDRNNQHKFIEGELNQDELNGLINDILNKK